MDDKNWRRTKRQQCWQGMTKWQKTIIGVLKRHVGNTKGVKLNMIFLSFQAIEGIKTLKIECIEHMLEDIEKYIWDVVGFRVENILYLYIF